MNNTRISYLGKEISVGIDVHRKFFVLSAVSEGELVKRCRMEASGRLVVEFLKKFFAGADVKVCYEAGFSGFWLHRYLEKHGIENIVVHAAGLETAARNRVKNDKRDSLKLAVQLDSGRLGGIGIPSEQQELARLISRTREQLIRQRTRVRNQIRMKFHQFGLLSAFDERSLSRRMVREVLEKDIPIELNLSVVVLCNIWDTVDEQLLILGKQLKEQAKHDENERIYVSISGFGPLTRRVLSNELGDMQQFKNVKQLYSFTGLTPGEYSTADHIRRGHISRQGRSQIRKALVEAAWRAVRKDDELKEIFERIAHRRGKKIAIVAIARKLIGRARAAFREQRANELAEKLAA